MKNLTEATDNLVEVMSSPQSSDKETNKALHKCFDFLPDSNEEEIGIFMKRVFALSSLPNMERGAFAATICGYLVERGFPGDAIVGDVIGFYGNLLDKAKPFFDLFFSKIREIDEMDEERDEKIDMLYMDLLNDEDFTDEEARNSVMALDKFYTCCISLFSVNRENFCKGKEALQKKVAYIDNYSQGCYWLNKLFGVLFDEPVVVIDIDNKIGFEGKISGVADNYQLQYLLMSIPMLNDGKSLISEESLAVLDGSGEQSSETIIEGKWNMYNLEVTEQSEWDDFVSGKNKMPDSSSDAWIWGEGEPQDISLHNGHRVILLGKPSYQRTSRVQRTFKNLEANIEIEKELTEEEINKWLKL